MSLRRILVVPDCHHPYADSVAWRVLLKVSKVAAPDVCVVIGDFADCLSVTQHPVGPERRRNLESEIDTVNTELENLEKMLPKACRRVFCLGNHENRLERYIRDRAPELFGLVSIEELLELREHDWKVVKYKDWITIGKVSFTHDLERSGVNACRQTLQEFGGNIVFGHSHRSSIYYEGTVANEHRVAMNVGWLGDANEIEYRHKASVMRTSQLGFGWVVQDVRTGNSWCHFIPIIGRTCIVDGKKITI